MNDTTSQPRIVTPEEAQPFDGEVRRTARMLRRFHGAMPDEGDHPWPCEPYRLAEALATALEELDRIATPTAERIDYGHEPTSGNGTCTICGRPNNDHETADV